MRERLYKRPEAARGADIPVDTVVDWQRRLGLFEKPLKERLRLRGKPVPPEPQRRYTLNNVCLLRAVRIMTQNGIPPRDAIPWCEATLPKHFDAIINGERKMAVAEVADYSVKIDLVEIVRDVRKRLELGTVHIAEQSAVKGTTHV
jgi:hypothetical protein